MKLFCTIITCQRLKNVDIILTLRYRVNFVSVQRSFCANWMLIVANCYGIVQLFILFYFLVISFFSCCYHFWWVKDCQYYFPYKNYWSLIALGFSSRCSSSFLKQFAAACYICTVTSSYPIISWRRTSSDLTSIDFNCWIAPNQWHLSVRTVKSIV